MSDGKRHPSENGRDMDEGTSMNTFSSSRPSKGTQRVKDTLINKKSTVNSLKKSPAALHKLNLNSFNSVNKPNPNH